MKKTPTLSREQQQLVVDNLGLVPYLSRALRSATLAYEDLIGWGQLGLVEAARRYDVTRGVKFATYAAWWARALMLNAITAEAGVKGKAAEGVYWHLWSEKSDAELAEVYRLSVEDVGSVRAACTQVPVRIDHDEVSAKRLTFGGVSPEAAAIAAQERRAVERAVNLLPRRLGIVIRGRFREEPEILATIGRRLGLSRERVRQLERRALERLRRKRVVKELAP